MISTTITVYTLCACVDWEIEKTPKTHLKKLEFNIDKPETGLKKIDLNININKNEIDVMKDDKMVHPSDDLADDIYNNIDYDNVDQKQTTNDNIYILANNKLQLSTDLD